MTVGRSVRWVWILALMSVLGLALPAHQAGLVAAHADAGGCGSAHADEPDEPADHSAPAGQLPDADDCPICHLTRELGFAQPVVVAVAPPTPTFDRLIIAEARPASADRIRLYFGRAPPAFS